MTHGSVDTITNALRHQAAIYMKCQILFSEEKKNNNKKTRKVSTVHGCPRCGVPDYKTAKFYLVQMP